MEEKTKIRIVKIAVYIGVLLAIILAANYAYWKVSIERSEEYRQEMSYQDYLSSSNRHLDYVFLGDSHLMLGLSPKIIKNSFNFGTVGENYIITYYKLQRVLEQDKVQVDVVVLALDPQSFSSLFVGKDYQFPHAWLSSRYVPLKDIAGFRKESLAMAYWDSRFPFMGNGQLFMGDLFVKKYFHQEYRGWFNYSNDFSNANKEEYAHRKYVQFYEGQEQLTDISLEYFLKTVLLAQSHNSTVVLVKFPHSQEYQDEIESHKLDTEAYYDAVFREMNKTVAKPYYFLDYYSLFFGKPNYLKDPDHVNYKGADILSKKFYNDMRKIQFAARESK